MRVVIGTAVGLRAAWLFCVPACYGRVWGYGSIGDHGLS